MVAILDAGAANPEFNFVLSKGDASQFKKSSAFKEIFLQPAGVSVKRVVLWYEENKAFLYKIEMFGKDDLKLLETGFPTNGCKPHEIILEEGEKIIGVKSRTYPNCPNYAFHCDF